MLPFASPTAASTSTTSALAPDQSDDLSFFTTAGAIDFTDTFYHGGYTGLEVTW